MKLELLVLFVVMYTVLSQNLEEEWKKFKLDNDKRYRTAKEEEMRKIIFAENLNMVTEHNKRFARGEETFSLKIHKYSDMAAGELGGILNGYRGGFKATSTFEEIPFTPIEGTKIPDELDWRKEGAVTRVKDQKYCASCWAFSAIGALESQHFLKTGKLITLSEQNIIDCSRQHDNQGCGGGDMIPAFEYVHVNDGVDSEDAYPYKGYDEVCHFDVSANVTSVRGYRSIKPGNEEYLKAAVATFGPVSVTIDAEQASFHNYASGVHYNPDCIEGIDDPELELNHGVIVVGYGTENGIDYWLVKNSWGGTWGDNGYIKMARNRGNNCGIASLASMPVLY